MCLSLIYESNKLVFKGFNLSVFKFFQSLMRKVGLETFNKWPYLKNKIFTTLQFRNWLPKWKRFWMLSHSVVSDSVTFCTLACQAPLSMGFSRQEYWNGLLFPSPRDLPDPGSLLCLLHCVQIFFYHWATGEWVKLEPNDCLWRNKNINKKTERYCIWCVCQNRKILTMAWLNKNTSHVSHIHRVCNLFSRVILHFFTSSYSMCSRGSTEWRIWPHNGKKIIKT